ncbi:MAG: monovalent cation/H(+) antiporter subunit G [Verrucomicrobiota bacterium]
MSMILSVLLIIGCSFVLIAAIGVNRFPDLYSRMHAATKAGAFGGSIIFITAALSFGTLEVWLEVVLIIVFFYLTAPVGSHIIGRAAYLSKTKLWPGTQSDDLAGKYNRSKGELRSK